jgi:uncharacterized protein (TIGR02145 family)
MKYKVYIFFLLMMSVSIVTVTAQIPQKMSYQAIIRGSNNDLLSNQAVGMKISILKGSVDGEVVYTETQTTMTNDNGLISIEIGGGQGFSTIDWGNGTYYIKTETDPNGGSNYTIEGVSQLLSVPYALYAGTTGSIDLNQNQQIQDFLIASGALVRDIDGNIYKTVTLGAQVWMAENLRVTHFNEGTPIPQITDNATWGSAGSAAYCWYNNDSAAYAVTYGALYNFYTVWSNSSKNVCPVGWHVPNSDEWNTLRNYLATAGFAYDNDKMQGYNKVAKSLAAVGGWNASTKTGAVGNTDYPYRRNATNFTARPAGYRSDKGFEDIGQGAYWWTSERYGLGSSNSWNYYISFDRTDLGLYYSDQKIGFSVRCIRDNGE